jgi:hypothetical protein
MSTSLRFRGRRLDPARNSTAHDQQAPERLAVTLKLLDDASGFRIDL